MTASRVARARRSSTARGTCCPTAPSGRVTTTSSPRREQTKTSKDQANAQKTRWEKQFDADQKKQNSARSKLDPLGRGVLVGAGVLALLLFAVPSALTGRTLGKAMRKIRVMKEDAVTPVGWQASFVRYGVIFSFFV